ncbi:MAG: ATP-binding cassette domain-containing protein [Deltaproteobacteria bacterium]|nr:ATP-binding cassette domain-containing protein [Deltaproteobacteria bacterium]
MIRVQRLTKHYKVHKRQPGVLAALRSVFRRRFTTVKAVDDISFEIAAGARVGFLGPNGAGKTTTLKVLAGLLAPTAGEVRVKGFVPNERRYEFLRSIMLVAGQKQQLLWDLPPADTFELNRAIYGIAPAEFRERLREMVELLEVEDVVKKPTRQLSLGERMKCELVAALLHRPTVLFLDEPTIGLDVTMQATVRRFVRTYNERYGATVLLTSHNMDDVAALCERVMIIHHGRLIFDGTLADLVRQTLPEKRVTLRLAKAVPGGDLAVLGRVVEHRDDAAILQVRQSDVSDIVKTALATLPVLDLNVEDAPLEEVLANVFAGAEAKRLPEAAS